MDNEQPKSDTPQLIAIAATILTGLLASGDYTVGAEHFPAYDRENKTGKPRARYRPEALADAVGLTIQLADAMGKLTEKGMAKPAPPSS